MATAPGAPAQVHPGKGLGFIALGSSLHHVLGRLRQHHRVFPSISTIYDPSHPLSSPVIILLDNNGIRLRFDAADQRLRLIEVLDFQKCRLTYNGGEVARTGTGGPTFKGIYNKLFGPTYPGEYAESQDLYVLSYPGVAFSFPVDKKTWKEDVDFVTLLSSPNAAPATSMAIFSGSSWAEVRNDLFTRSVQTPRNPTVNGASARLSPANDEIEHIKVHDNNKIELSRRHNPAFWITLHSTTPQDLIAELGPPSAIYRKNDHRLSIHRTRAHDDADDTEPDDAASDVSEGDASDLIAAGSGDCFYNYFSHGIDVFVSALRSSSHPVVTKVFIHGNVPGSYEFQRYRRCRWSVELGGEKPLDANSEEGYDSMLKKLRERFGRVQKPMPLNRANDSPSSSCELLGGLDDVDGGGLGKEEEGGVGVNGFESELHGFPGLIFEVMKNKTVTCLTVF